MVGPIAKKKKKKKKEEEEEGKKKKKLKSVVEEVLNLHFDEIELVVVLKSLHVGKYFDKILSNMPPPQ